MRDFRGNPEVASFLFLTVETMVLVSKVADFPALSIVGVRGREGECLARGWKERKFAENFVFSSRSCSSHLTAVTSYPIKVSHQSEEPMMLPKKTEKGFSKGRREWKHKQQDMTKPLLQQTLRTKLHQWNINTFTYACVIVHLACGADEIKDPLRNKLLGVYIKGYCD